MRHAIFLFVLAVGASGCQSVDCGPGTIERNGTCQPPDSKVDPATCGEGTTLVGDRCEPTLPPTKCDPGTTAMMPDPNDPSVTICVGMGGTGCSGAFACPAPSGGKQTICGQLYDITDNSKFQATDHMPTGAICTGSETSGPCALKISTFDALLFGMNPNDPNAVLANGGVEIDDCGRYRVKSVTQPASPFIGLGIDDANAANMGPPGITNIAGVATAANPDSSTTNLEAWIAPKATTDMWTAAGGPPVSGGIYVGIFRAHKCDATGNTCTGDKFANQMGVTFTLSGSTLPNDDYYFKPTDVGHTMLDTTATSTGVNGTGLLKNASVSNNINYSGVGGITDTTNCQWEVKAAASVANIVFFQVYRKTNRAGRQCQE